MRKVEGFKLRQTTKEKPADLQLLKLTPMHLIFLFATYVFYSLTSSSDYDLTLLVHTIFILCCKCTMLMKQLTTQTILLHLTQTLTISL
eukprot:g6188.t1